MRPEPGATVAAPIELIGAFESTYQPIHDVDVAETTGHIGRWREDLALLLVRGPTPPLPVRWHRVEAEPGRFDWTATDLVLEHLQDAGMAPLVDLVHHTSYPRWLHGGFADPRFAPSYLRYVEAFARRYPWVDGYTLFNEPFTTFFLCGQEALWPPLRSRRVRAPVHQRLPRRRRRQPGVPGAAPRGPTPLSTTPPWWARMAAWRSTPAPCSSIPRSPCTNRG